MSKIALIANGISTDDPEALEVLLRNQGQEVDIFDVRALQKTATGFAVLEGGVARGIDPTGYTAVARIIKGGNPGDTAKSWELQKFFEDAGAKPHISIDAARKVTDKILCKEVLTAKAVPVFSSVTFTKDERTEPATIEAAIQALGEPPYVVRKSIGSGKDSLVIATTLNDAIHVMEKFRTPAEPQAVKSGVMVHKLPSTLDTGTVQRYGLDAIAEPEKRTYQFRVILVDGKIFGANIGYSEPGKFGLNPAQGITFKALQEESIPMEVLALAKRASAAHDLKIAAVDIALDKQSKPQVLDMNASPDLSFTNARSEQLKHAVAQSIQTMAMQGPQAEAHGTGTSTPYSGRL